MRQAAMDHVAIMNKSWKLIPKILSGQKRIESRWYVARSAPWNRIRAGDTVYFRDSGMPVTAKAGVDKVLQLENYSGEELREILDSYHGTGGISFASGKDEIFEWAIQKKYCILIFLKNPVAVAPFKVDKSGFGNACAWMCVNDIRSVML